MGVLQGALQLLQGVRALFVAVAAMVWGATAILLAGLAGVPVMLSVIVYLARPRRI